MLASARPLFENVPGTFADPLGLADQQAEGVVALIVARYEDEDTSANVSIASTTSTDQDAKSPSWTGGDNRQVGAARGGGPTEHEARAGRGGGPDDAPAPPAQQDASSEAPPSPIPARDNRQVGEAGAPIPHPPWPQATYDTFVAASGGLVAVARTTPDYRFPVAPAAAIARFHAARDAGRAPALSLFAVSEADAAHFLETAFYAECLKVHVDGPASAGLVRAQLARCGCTSGLLEANDFSDPAAPTVRLAEVAGDAPTLDLDALLSGVHGRVLLYDRAKNQAVARDRASAPLNLAAAVAEADRLARARRPAPAIGSTEDTPSTPPETDTPHATPPGAEPPPTEPPSPADLVANDLRQRAEHPAPPSPLSALVAELQGRTPTPEAQEESPLPSGDRASDGASQGQGEGPIQTPAEAPASTDDQCASVETPSSPASEANRQVGGASGIPHPPSPPPQAAHPLAPDLDRLRTDAYALLETAVGRDRAAALDAHVRAEHGWVSPVPSEHTLAHLRALLFDNPPKRWHLFKRARTKTHADVAALLLTFHAAHGHDPRPLAQEAVMEATQLWTRLHK